MSSQISIKLILRLGGIEHFSVWFPPSVSIGAIGISLIRICRWNMDLLDVPTTFWSPKINNDNIHITIPETYLKGLNMSQLIVTFRKPLYHLKQSPKLWYNDINNFQISLGVTEYLAVSNLYLWSGGILILLYINNISMWYLKATVNAAIVVNVKLLKTFRITHHHLPHQFISIEIHCNSITVRISLIQTHWISAILWRLSLMHTHGGLKPIDLNEILDLTMCSAVKNFGHVTDSEAFVQSLMYLEVAMWPASSYAVATLSCFNLWPFTSGITAAKSVPQYLKAIFSFQLHSISNDIVIDIDHRQPGNNDSDWTNDSGNWKFNEVLVFLDRNSGTVSWQSRNETLSAMVT